MQFHDKRLFNRIDQSQQEKYLKDLLKQIPDSSDKCERIDITHEPIKLLKRKKLAHDAVAIAAAPVHNEQQ